MCSTHVQFWGTLLEYFHCMLFYTAALLALSSNISIEHHQCTYIVDLLSTW